MLIINRRQRGVYRCGMAVVLLILSASIGCRRTTRIATIPPPVPLPKTFSASGTKTVPADWWTVFNCPQLNQLESRVLTDNFSLRAAWNRLQQVETLVQKAAAVRQPWMNHASSATRTQGRSRSNTGFGKVTQNVRSTQLLLSGMASYEVDLWGRLQANEDAARFDLRASQEEIQAAILSLSAETTRNWFTLAAVREEIAIVQEQIKLDKKYESLVRLRRQQGQAGASDVLQQQQHTEATRSDLVRLKSRLILPRHALAYLAGSSPRQFSFQEPEKLPELPPLPATGVPIELIRRRPDVRAAWLHVAAADRRVAAALADRFPRLTFSLNSQVSGNSIPNLFRTWLTHLSAGIAGPVFDAGMRQAEIKRTRAVAAEAVNQYGDVCLRALREVEDSLEQEQRQRQILNSTQKQLRLANQALGQIRDQYMHGQIDYLRVLDALRACHALQRIQIQVRGGLFTTRLALYRALAGRTNTSTTTGAK